MKFNLKKDLIYGMMSVAVIAPLAMNGNTNVNARARHIRVARVAPRIPAKAMRKINAKYYGYTAELKAANHEIKSMQKSARRAHVSRKTKRQLGNEIKSVSKTSHMIQTEVNKDRANDVRNYQKTHQAKRTKRNRHVRKYVKRSHRKIVRK